MDDLDQRVAEEERAERRRDRLRIVAVLAAVLLAASALGWRYWSRSQPAQAPVPQVEASSPGPAPAAAVVSPEGPTCYATIGPEVPQVPEASHHTVTPGQTAVIVVRCTGPTEYADLVMTVVGRVAGAAEMQQMTLPDGTTGWVRALPIAADTPAMELTFYPFVDGRPAGEPVVLVVEGVSE